ncbi:MAG: hypothetical protein V7K73_25940 [Nostoc sp.]
MISFRPLILITGRSIALLFLLSNWCVQAQNQLQNIELKVYSENEQKQSCPDKVIVTEKAHPYQEGSFSTDGSVNLSAYASNMSVKPVIALASHGLGHSSLNMRNVLHLLE